MMIKKSLKHADLRFLLEIVENKTHPLRKQAVIQCGKRGDSDAVEPLLAVLGDENEHIRKNAILALGRLGDQRAVTPLVQALSDHTPMIRRAAVKSLIRLGLPTVTEPLVAELGTKNAHTRKLAAEVLTKTGWKSANDREKARYLAARLQFSKLEAIGKDAVDILVVAANDQRPDIRKNAIRTLGKIGDGRGADRTFAALSDEDPTIRKIAKQAFAHFKDPEAVEASLAALKSQDQELVDIAIDNLDAARDARGLDPLYLLLDSLERKSPVVSSTIPWLQERIYNIEIALKNISERLIDEPLDLICSKCIYEYQKVSLDQRYISYYGCPHCRSNSFWLDNVSHIVLSMDRSFKTPWERKGETLTVNWYHKKEPFDLDEIRILHAGDYDVEEMVMKLKNDRFKGRRKRLSQIPVYLSPGLSISAAQKNMLEDNFKEVIDQ